MISPFIRLPENAHCKEVFLNKLFWTKAGTASLFNSTTTRIPSLSDSSLKSDIPSNFLSFTKSAIFSNNAVRLNKIKKVSEQDEK